MRSIVPEIRHALRVLGKSPGFAVTAVVTLALGIGASTAIFSVVDSVILKPLSYPDSGRLVALWERVWFLGPDPTGPNPHHADVWRQGATAFSGMALVRQTAGGLAFGTGHPRLVGMVIATPNLLDVLQVRPIRGRTFVPEDGIKGHDRVAILTWNVWQTVFGGDPKVVGKTVQLDDIPREVIGVLAEDFRFPGANALRAFRSKQAVSRPPEPAIFIPAVIDLSQFDWNGEYGNWVALARLKPGVTARQAESQLNSLRGRILEHFPAGDRAAKRDGFGALVQPMQEAMIGDFRTGLWLLMGAVIGFMLIACLNLANAQLGWALSRQREAAIRAALGATQSRLLWSSLAESFCLAAMGGAAGVLLAAAGLRLFRAVSLVDLPRLAEVQLNVTVLLFALVLTLGSCVLFGILPALKMLRADPQASLQQGGSRMTGFRQSHQLRTWLIGMQVFGCTILLLVTGLFSKSLLDLLHRDIGFETSHVAVAEVRLATSYSTNESRSAFDDAVLRNLREIPGVQQAGLVSAMFLEGETWIDYLQRADRSNQEGPLINLRWVSPGYFETVREKLVAGRFFEERDRKLKSVVISEGEARALWGNSNPVGAQVRMRGDKYTVVGVVGDSRNTSLKTLPPKVAYLHYDDKPPYTSYFMARSTGSANELLASMRQAVWKQAPDVTIARVKTLDSQLTDSLAAERFQTSVLASFGIGALLLAMLGIYCVLSYATIARKAEIGLRMALGSTRSGIYKLTVSEAGAPVFAGLGAGIFVSFVAGRTIRKLLFGVEAYDPLVIFLVTALLLTAALAAAFLPARRAASIDPMEALRSE